MPTNDPTSVNIYILNLDLENILIEEYVIESRIESSREKDLNKFEIWENDKKYNVSNMTFDETIVYYRKVGDLKKDDIHWYISFTIHTSIVKKS